MFYIFILKRLLDFVISFVLLILLSPVFMILIVLLFISNKGKPFFFQKRPGKNSKVFNVVKFKTMNDEKDLKGELLTDDKRLTPVGEFIRKTSLDEIPQLINVLKGDMSLVGPRPLLVEYLQLYNDNQIRRHEVKPGITGLAQINGRNEISWEEKFKYDLEYVDNCSFLLDFKIFVKTFKKVFKSEGISSDTHVTMEKFKGNE